MTNAATDTGIVVNPCLSALFDVYGFLGTIGLATASRTSAAEVCDFIINLHASRASFINHAHDVIFRCTVFRPVQRTGRIFGQGGQLIRFILHVQSQQRQ